MARVVADTHLEDPFTSRRSGPGGQDRATMESTHWTFFAMHLQIHEFLLDDVIEDQGLRELAVVTRVEDGDCLFQLLVQLRSHATHLGGLHIGVGIRPLSRIPIETDSFFRSVEGGPASSRSCGCLIAEEKSEDGAGPLCPTAFSDAGFGVSEYRFSRSTTSMQVGTLSSGPFRLESLIYLL